MLGAMLRDRKYHTALTRQKRGATFYENDDMTTGHPMTVFIIFFETHVLAPLFYDLEGEAVNKQRVATVAVNVVEHCRSYLAEYTSSDKFQSFLARMKAMVLLFGKMPFMLGTKIEDLKKMDEGSAELKSGLKTFRRGLSALCYLFS